MNLYISPAIPDNVNHHLFSKQLQQELDLPEVPNIYMTGELGLLLEFTGALYITGHLTRGEFKRFSKSFDSANEDVFREIYKTIMKREQLEAMVLEFDAKRYDHRELLNMVIEFFPHLPKQLPVLRIGDTIIFCDDMTLANELVLGYMEGEDE